MAAEEQEVRAGKCKWFNVVKGYGFIIPDDGGQEVFVHQSVLVMPGFRSLGTDEPVEFNSKSCEKGFEATKVWGQDGAQLKGNEKRPMSKRKVRKIRCYNCGEFGTHIASKCPHPPMPKRCHHCKSEGHLVADCPQKLHQSDSNCSSTSATNSSDEDRGSREEPAGGNVGVTQNA